LLTHIKDDNLGTAGDRLQHTIAIALEADDSNDESNGQSRQEQVMSMEVDKYSATYKDWLHVYVSPIHGNAGYTGYQLLGRVYLHTILGRFHFIALIPGVFGDLPR